ncbi:MAG: hypothetical protein PHN56_00225 [Candidatus Nanoarchaeia archaeon]|nr:hypothetical protein [Candidatus Nanoarchaeia archaeon]
MTDHLYRFSLAFLGDFNKKEFFSINFGSSICELYPHSINNYNKNENQSFINDIWKMYEIANSLMTEDALILSADSDNTHDEKPSIYSINDLIIKHNKNLESDIKYANALIIRNEGEFKYHYIKRVIETYEKVKAPINVSPIIVSNKYFNNIRSEKFLEDALIKISKELVLKQGKKL